MKIRVRVKRMLAALDRAGDIKPSRFYKRSTSGANAVCRFRGNGYWHRQTVGQWHSAARYVGPVSPASPPVWKPQGVCTAVAYACPCGR